MSEEAPRESKPFEESIEKLIARLRRVALPPNVFNIYHTGDPAHDVRGGAAKRRENLRRYLKALPDPKFVLIGLCPGWRGARFTGVPFTDEARLCLTGSCYDRTSSSPEPLRERSAGVAMDLIGARTDVVCWNAVPWHCHEADEPMSNATPSAEAINLGAAELEYFLARLYPRAQPVSVGEIARDVLSQVSKRHGIPPADSGIWSQFRAAIHVRHPAHGGEKEFREGLARILGITLHEDADD
ncbi:MAG: uracil-DNA glycosylase [Planctomycetes bacterium]|nr:uracil-DNA glycosylase [Planctomycetota bacterium]